MGSIKEVSNEAMALQHGKETTEGNGDRGLYSHMARREWAETDPSNSERGTLN